MIHSSFIYYDEHTGEIKAISPVKNDEFSQWACTKVPLPIATKFISGEWDTTKWYVGSDSTEEKGVVRQTQFDFIPVVSDDLVSIPRTEASLHYSSAITITVFTSIKTVEISVSKVNADVDVSKLPVKDMMFYLTKRNDPSIVYGEFSANVEELFEKGVLTFTYDFDATDVSVYTKKLFRFYQLTVKKNKMSKRKTQTNLRVNTLVPYKAIESVTDIAMGLVVVHNVNNGVLEIFLKGDVDDITSDLNNDVAPLFLTRPRDPTVLIDSLSFSLKDLSDNNVVKIAVPKEVGVEFGVSGYPYIDNLFFMRT